LEFFTSQFEFFDVAAEQFEYKTKDTARLSGVEWHNVTALDTGRDRLKDLGCQTRNGLSVRAMMTLMLYSKGIAYFRGNNSVELEDVRQVLPFVLHSKLSIDPDAPFFDAPGNAPYRTDRIGWLRKLLDLSCAEFDRIDLDRDDPVGQMLKELKQGLDGISDAETRARLVKIERLIADWSRGGKLYGHLYDDVLALKYMHQRYTNYLRWLKTQ
jgi:MoxR-like ATPase